MVLDREIFFFAAYAFATRKLKVESIEWAFSYTMEEEDEEYVDKQEIVTIKPIDQSKVNRSSVKEVGDYESMT